MSRMRVLDACGVVLLTVAGWLWWVGVPPAAAQVLAVRTSLGTSNIFTNPAPDVTRTALVALLLAAAVLAITVVLVPRRSAAVRAVAALPLLGLTVALSAWQLVQPLVTESIGPRLLALTPPTGVAATTFALTGIALTVPVPAARRLAAVLVAVAAVASVFETQAVWSLFGGLTTAADVPWYDNDVIRVLVPWTAATVAAALLGLAVAAGLIAPRRPVVREVATGATFLWGAVALTSLLLPLDWWARLQNDPYAHVATFGLNSPALWTAPAAAILLAALAAAPAAPAAATAPAATVPAFATAPAFPTASALATAAADVGSTPLGRDAARNRVRGAAVALAVLIVLQSAWPVATLLVSVPTSSAEVARFIGAEALSLAAALMLAVVAVPRSTGLTRLGAAAGVAALAGMVRALSRDLDLAVSIEPLVVGVLAPAALAIIAATTLARRQASAPRHGSQGQQAATPGT